MDWYFGDILRTLLIIAFLSSFYFLDKDQKKFAVKCAIACTTVFLFVVLFLFVFYPCELPLAWDWLDECAVYPQARY